MSPLQKGLYGPRCFCAKHRSLSLAICYPGRRRVVEIRWNGKRVKVFPWDINKISPHEAWVQKHLPVSKACLMTNKELRRGNVDSFSYEYEETNQ